jgi:hypothetical protein
VPPSSLGPTVAPLAPASRDEPERPVGVIYLAWLGQPIDGPIDGPWSDVFALEAQLVLIESEQSRSRVYHALKDLLPAGAPLLVQAIHDPPKFKGLAPGATAWLRSHPPS